MSKTIGIVSIKGGVGKTSAVSALGAAFANQFNKKVLLIDGNFSAPTLGFHIGLYNPEITLHHVLDGKANAKDAIYETEHGFDVIPGALVYDNMSKINPFKLSEKIRDLKRKYDIILIDSSPNLNEEILATMIASDELLIVTTPDYVTLASTLRAIKSAKERRTPITGIILNKVHGKDFELSLEDIENMSGSEVLAVLPHELDILEALSIGKPSTLHNESDSTVEYKKLAGSLIGEDYQDRRKKTFGKWLRVFMKKIPQQEINRVILKDARINNPFYK
jgi:MinD-like ATPase involved in chromosome partitioning or flagellar assembly